MEKTKMMDLLIDRIKHCYKQLLQSRAHPPAKVLYIEGFRCRLDELILYYHLVRNISFVEACKELDINPQEIDFAGNEK